MNKRIEAIMNRIEVMSAQEVAQEFYATRQDLENLRGLLRVTDVNTETYDNIRATMAANVKVMNVLTAQSAKIRTEAFRAEAYATAE